MKAPWHALRCVLMLATGCQPTVVAPEAAPARVRSALPAAAVTPPVMAPPASPAPIPPAPESERTLSRLLQVAIDPDVTVNAFARLFGSPEPRPDIRFQYVFINPFPDADGLSVVRHRNQNREVLARVNVEFRAEVAPTISDVAARLGVSPPSGRVEIDHRCSHGPCPSYALQVAHRGKRIVVRLSLAVKGFTLGERFHGTFERDGDPQTLRVRALGFSINQHVCPVGEPLSGEDRVVMRRAESDRELWLVKSVVATARALGGDSYDLGAVERALGVTLPRGEDRYRRSDVPFGAEPHATLLGPSFEAKFQADATRDAALIDLLPIRGDNTRPLALAGLRYVEDPARLCQLYGSGHHIYELPAEPGAKFRVAVIMLVDRDGGNDEARILRIRVTRAPSGSRLY